MWLDVSISLIGAAVSGLILAVMWKSPPGRRSARLWPWWLVAWGTMCVHFVLNALYTLNVPAVGLVAGLLLAVAIWTLVDGVVGSGSPALQWMLRGFALLTAVWVLFAPDWTLPRFPSISVYTAFGVELIAGSLAASRLHGTSRLTRRVLALGLLGWGIGMMLPFRSEAALLFINVETLICKTICGLALVLFIVDEQRSVAESHRDYLNDLYHKAPVWYHTAALDGTILDINQVALDMLGCSREEVVQKRKMAELCTPESARWLPPLGDFVVNNAKLRETRALELEILARGQTHAMRCYLRPVFETDLGTPVIRCVLLDVTQEKELQQQLLEAQKLKALGTLTAGLAHDFNNILSAQLGQLELISIQYRDRLPGDVASRLDIVQRSGQLAANLVAQLLTFARRGRRQMGPVNLWETVLEIEGLLRHSFPRNVEIRTRCDGGEYYIWGNAAQLQQAFLNLAVNAQQAMPSGGTLEFAVSTCESLPGNLELEAQCERSGECVCVQISDSGEGMSEAVRKQIFEPFFTTREHGHGTGLGLATVYGIVEAHQGLIHVDSAPGKGTIFSIYLPAAVGVPAEGLAEEQEQRGGAESYRVLLVEDEAAVADVTSQLLSSLGHLVTTRSLPHEALDLVRSGERPFDLLVTDLTMPEMNGYELAERIHQIWPGLPVLLVSGYDFHGEGTPGGMVTLAKPLTMSGLRRGVDEAMAAAGARPAASASAS